MFSLSLFKITEELQLSEKLRMVTQISQKQYDISYSLVYVCKVKLDPV